MEGAFFHKLILTSIGMRYFYTNENGACMKTLLRDTSEIDFDVYKCWSLSWWQDGGMDLHSFLLFCHHGE